MTIKGNFDKEKAREIREFLGLSQIDLAKKVMKDCSYFEDRDFHSLKRTIKHAETKGIKRYPTNNPEAIAYLEILRDNGYNPYNL